MELRAETSVFDDKLLKEDVDNAQETADNAQVIAGTTAQYFWFLEEIGSVPEGVGTGAHITNLTKEEFLYNPANGGGNLLARSNGIAIRDGLTELAYFSGTAAQIGKSNSYNSYFDAQSFQIRNGSTLLSKFTSNGVDVYLANDSANSVANFGTTSRIGKSNTGHVQTTANGLNIYGTTGADVIATFGANNNQPYARLGKTTGQRFEITNSLARLYTSDGYQRLYIDGSSGVIVGKPDAGRTQITDTGMLVFDQNNKGRTFINKDGMTVYDTNGWVSTDYTANSIANFSAISRIGYLNSFYLELSSNQIAFKNGQYTPARPLIISNTNVYSRIYKSSLDFTTGPVIELYNNGEQRRVEINDANTINLVGLTRLDLSTPNIYCRGTMHFNTFNTGIYMYDNLLQDIDVLRLGSNNNLVVGYGQYALNEEGHDTYVEGYNVILRARNRYYLNTTSGTQITSDRRLKKDIVSVSDSIKDVFMSLRPVEYRSEKSLDTQKHFGFIAQEVDKAFSDNGVQTYDYSIVDEYMPTDTEERIAYKTLCYTEFIPLCVKMIQMQQEEIDRLKEKLA